MVLTSVESTGTTPSERDSTEPARLRPRGPRHIPALDGLRGIAVAIVLLYHAGDLQGGFLGVDLFFVLSGFLITGILVSERERSGRIDLKHFWVRRARRLMPALLALLVAVSLFAVLTYDPSELAVVRADALGTLLYVANWVAALSQQTYWDEFAAPSPLAHTWSLAIEEQFYLVWPLVVWGVFRLTRGSTKVLLAVTLGLAAISATLLVVLYSPGSDRAYLGTDTRGAAILLGSALAIGLHRWGFPAGTLARRALAAVGTASLALLAAAWFLVGVQDELLYRGGFLVTELATLALLVAIAHPQAGLLARALGARPLVWLGLISYGAYLWHWPIYLFLSPERMGFEGPALTALRISVSLIVAMVSAALLEQPIRRHGLPRGVAPRWAVPATLVLVMATILGATAASEPARDVAAAQPSTATTRVPAGVPHVMVVGDSVADSLAQMMLVRKRATGVGPAISNRSIAGCALTADDVPTRTWRGTVDCTPAWSADAQRLRPTEVVLLLGGATKAHIQVDGRWQAPCDSGWRQAFATELRKGVQQLGASGARVAVATTPTYRGGSSSAEGSIHVACANEVIAEVVRSVPGARLIDLNGWLCPEGTCRDVADGEPIRKDGLHFGNKGGEFVAAWVIEQLGGSPP